MQSDIETVPTLLRPLRDVDDHLLQQVYEGMRGTMPVPVLPLDGFSVTFGRQEGASLGATESRKLTRSALDGNQDPSIARPSMDYSTVSAASEGGAGNVVANGVLLNLFSPEHFLQKRGTMFAARERMQRQVEAAEAAERQAALAATAIAERVAVMKLVEASEQSTTKLVCSPPRSPRKAASPLRRPTSAAVAHYNSGAFSGEANALTINPPTLSKPHVEVLPISEDLTGLGMGGGMPYHLPYGTAIGAIHPFAVKHFINSEPKGITDERGPTETLPPIAPLQLLGGMLFSEESGHFLFQHMPFALSKVRKQRCLLIDVDPQTAELAAVQTMVTEIPLAADAFSFASSGSRAQYPMSPLVPGLGGEAMLPPFPAQQSPTDIPASPLDGGASASDRGAGDNLLPTSALKAFTAFGSSSGAFDMSAAGSPTESSLPIPQHRLTPTPLTAPLVTSRRGSDLPTLAAHSSGKRVNWNDKSKGLSLPAIVNSKAGLPPRSPLQKPKVNNNSDSEDDGEKTNLKQPTEGRQTPATPPTPFSATVPTRPDIPSVPVPPLSKPHDPASARPVAKRTLKYLAIKDITGLDAKLDRPPTTNYSDGVLASISTGGGHLTPRTTARAEAEATRLRAMRAQAMEELAKTMQGEDEAGELPPAHLRPRPPPPKFKVTVRKFQKKRRSSDSDSEEDNKLPVLKVGSRASPRRSQSQPSNRRASMQSTVPRVAPSEGSSSHATSTLPLISKRRASHVAPRTRTRVDARVLFAVEEYEATAGGNWVVQVFRILKRDDVIQREARQRQQTGAASSNSLGQSVQQKGISEHNTVISSLAHRIDCVGPILTRAFPLNAAMVGLVGGGVSSQLQQDGRRRSKSATSEPSDSPNPARVGSPHSISVLNIIKASVSAPALRNPLPAEEPLRHTNTALFQWCLQRDPRVLGANTAVVRDVLLYFKNTYSVVRMVRRLMAAIRCLQRFVRNVLKVRREAIAVMLEQWTVEEHKCRERLELSTQHILMVEKRHNELQEKKRKEEEAAALAARRKFIKPRGGSIASPRPPPTVSDPTSPSEAPVLADLLHYDPVESVIRSILLSRMVTPKEWKLNIINALWDRKKLKRRDEHRKAIAGVGLVADEQTNVVVEAGGAPIPSRKRMSVASPSTTSVANPNAYAIDTRYYESLKRTASGLMNMGRAEAALAEATEMRRRRAVRLNPQNLYGGLVHHGNRGASLKGTDAGDLITGSYTSWRYDWVLPTDLLMQESLRLLAGELTGNATPRTFGKTSNPPAASAESQLNLSQETSPSEVERVRRHRAAFDGNMMAHPLMMKLLKEVRY